MILLPLRPLAASACGLFLLALGGCGTIASLDDASRHLDTFELNPIEVAGVAGGGAGGATLYVAEPLATGAIASDRIVIKPDPYRVAFLPDGRWVDPAGTHVQQIITRSLSRLNRYGLVTSSTSAPLPDYSLVTDLEAFQIEVAPADAPAPYRVVIRLQAAMVRESDSRIIARQRFEAAAFAANSTPGAVIPAFDVAMEQVLRGLTSWVTATSPGGV
ncbi:ABC-type transport auxiliary lipoprotein family protein [Amaricoccus macauensis]|uniref:ABC-type transport auxiliary lipoprotein family protein n=1 Tax=Amaricoccus macauensis TaxID=57001 RepID=UPI003C798559